jgi:hypothetical protein
MGEKHHRLHGNRTGIEARTTYFFTVIVDEVCKKSMLQRSTQEERSQTQDPAESGKALNK